MITAAAVMAIVSLTCYVVFGSLVDALEARRTRQEHLVMDVLSQALYADAELIGPMLGRLRGVSNGVLLGLALRIPLHFDDQLSHRLVDIVATTRARRRVRRACTSRFWPRRVRAARLVHILPNAEPVVARLLADRHPAVRAAAIEAMGADEIAAHADRLLELLDDDSVPVRFTAQQALLRGDGRVVMPLVRALPHFEGDTAVRGLEVASNFGDPRLLPAIRVHATADDSRVRRLVARALPLGAGTAGLNLFEALLADFNPAVRVAAIEAVARLRADWLTGRLGRALRDGSWEVRRAAGDALAELGPIGVLMLRHTLDGDDPYAADMARQVLDSLTLAGRIAPIEPHDVDRRLDPLVPLEAA